MCHASALPLLPGFWLQRPRRRFLPRALAAARPCPTSRDRSRSKAEASPNPVRPDADPRRSVEVYGERYRANPKDADAALRYGQALRATGQRAQAVAVFEQATIAHSGNKALLAGYGRALADNGNFQRAFDVLTRAHSPDNPDWRILSVQGTALDQLGRHEEARRYYASALQIVPEEPSVLSNLGLSYVLSKELPKAEETLRRAHASPAPTRGCGKIWPRGRPAGPFLPRPKASSRRIFRRKKPPPMSPI